MKSDKLKAILMSIFFFLIITSYYVIKPVRNSLITAVLGTNAMATLNIALIFVITICVLIYNYILGKFKKSKVIAGAYLFFISNLILFWGLHKFHDQAGVENISGVFLQLFPNFDYIMGVCFFLWVGAYNVIIVSIFFTFCNDIFTSENGKKYYALIGAGGVIGGVAGSEISSFFVKFLGSTNLLMISAAILSGCLIIIMIIFSMLKSENRYDQLMNRIIQTGEKPSTLDAIKVFKKNKYAFLIAQMILLLTMMATLLSFVFSYQTELEIVVEEKEIIQSLSGKYQEYSKVTYGLESDNTFIEYLNGLNGDFKIEKLPDGLKKLFLSRGKKLKQEKATAFWARFHKYMGYLSIFIQVFLTKFINTRYGIPFSVFLLPLVFLFGSLSMCVVLNLSMIWWISLFQFGIGYSIFQSSKEQLFLPAGEEVKYRAKSVIDSVVVRGADAISSMIFHILISLLALSYKSLVLCCVILCIPLINVLIKLKKHYYQLLLTNNVE
ncbi:hypothetical protein KAJ27_17360 [bacterium]|nr:hypothetical protein [bacterium]